MARLAVSQTQRPNLNANQKERCILRIQRCIGELRALDISKVTKRFQQDPEVIKIAAAIEDVLTTAFGDSTPDYNRYKGAAKLDNGTYVMRMGNPFGGGYVVDYDERDAIDARENIKESIPKSIALLEGAIVKLTDEIADENANIKIPVIVAPKFLSHKIFVVHGHNGEAKNEVARFLNKIELEEIILHERPNMGRHILTKFQEESEGAGFAVVIMTPDDQGSAIGGELKKRARQNVIFELGFFIGKLGHSKVVALVKGEIEKPSDFDGIVYIQLDNDGGWKSKLAKELKAAKVVFNFEAAIDA